MASHTFDALPLAVGKTVKAIFVSEGYSGDRLHLEFTDGSEMIINSSEWLSDMEYNTNVTT